VKVAVTFLGAVIVTDLSPSQTRQLGLRRLAGSALGATVGAAISYYLPSAPWSIGLSVLVAMFLSQEKYWMMRR
jgi:uncharacterized membrane protein YgaE (UPF0421/DUF939 family)